ncbi:two-component system KDP operon response regulator KdpE [Sphingopyxis italica]|uniref:Two-component system KDP operon response regulator KdpE n=1 Tax=Sphingopyxis italica TaxID=1129133 RepID=A0A7X6B7F9_9SPHN|nr:response regulator transcription factor [Sphingopyxis italica]NJB88264.1 two-component system KDP operon response regulator KdpE [Sphingopyxis italica]
MSQGAKILIVEDDPHIRRLLRATMHRAGHAVVEAADARQAIALLDIERPDVVLLDLGLPDRDGLELIGLIRLRSAAIVIVVSARDDGAEKVTALDLGADDYVTKPFDTDELLARIRTALRHLRTAAAGEPVSIVEAGAVRIDLEHRRVLKDEREVHLTPKEYAVLAELAQRPDRVLSHTQLLKSVWGPAHVERVEYLRIAVRGLRQKLEVDPAQPKLIINELAVGYRLRA